MSFETVEVTAATAGRAGTGVSVGLIKLGKRPCFARVSLSEAALQKMGWNDGQLLALSIGTAEHDGLMRLTPKADGSGARVARMGAGMKRPDGKVIVTYRIKLGVQPKFPDTAFKSQPCAWEALSGGVMEVTLPDWKPKVRVTTHVHVGQESELQRQNREAKEARARMGMK
jgi:hypothetical protein